MYFTPGSHIWWRYRRSSWSPSKPENVRPMTVVHDDADGLVAWLAPATPVVRTVLNDGRNVRELPLHERYGAGRAAKHDIWYGTGILKLAPPDVPWSVWVFWDEDWNHLFWYVNLEDIHRREGRNVITQDHVLDLVVYPDGSLTWKDEDELEAAVAAGRYGADDAARFEADAREVGKLVATWGPPFCDGWQDWRPNSTWSLPALPHDVVTQF